LDPLAFRRLNTLKPGAVTLTGEKVTANTGNPTKCLDVVSESIGYGSLTPEEAAREQATGRKIGKGIAALHKAPAMPPFTASSVVLKMNSDGTVVVNAGLTEIGQGAKGSLAQVVAERLRFDLARIRISPDKDTDRDPYDWQTVASKGLVLAGNAAILACDDLLAKAYEVAGQVLRAQPADLDHDGEKIFVKHHRDRSVTFAALAIGYAYPDGNAIGGPLIGVGRYIAQGLANLDKETGQGNCALDWTFGAHGVVVEADPESGEYRVLKICSAFDVGKAVHAEILRGQAVGGMVQGLGTACCEGFIYDEQGHLLNPSFTDNKIPTARDIPDEIESVAVETPQLDGPFGARGVGEHPMISVAPAIGNALKHALGVELTHMPMRAEDVWRAMNLAAPIDNWITKTPNKSCKK